MSKPNRNITVDVIRTVALVGICVVNVPFMALPVENVFLPPEGLADQIVVFLAEALFQMKFFLLFSFIFGWGLYIQDRSAARAGVSFAARYMRRLLGLACLAACHAVLVFTGDILIIYALIGLTIWPFRHMSPRALICLALWMIPLAVISLTVLGVILSEPLDILPSGLGGTYGEATASRLRDWAPTLMILLLFQAPLVLAAFATGLAAGKAGFFEENSIGRCWLKKALPWLILGGVTFNLFFAASMSALLPKNDILDLLGLISIALGAPMLSGVYLYALLWLSERIALPEFWVRAGRNSLSAYVLQGVLAGLLFGGYGAGWFDQVGQAGLLPISILIAIMAMAITSLFARAFGRAPLEAALRRITYWH